MKLNSDRIFAVEIHPADWRFPAGKTWIAGWLHPEKGQVITDVRARLHHRVILGLAGLPHPAFPEKAPESPGFPDAGFSFLLSPHPGATLLQLEARDLSGQWQEFFRTTISVAPEAPTPPAAPNLSQALGRLTARLLKRRRRSPGRAWSDLADELIAAFVSEPLHAHPNLPFIGALEEPHEIGRLRYGRIPVTGWLAHTAQKITQLSAVIDSQPAIRLPHGLARSDLSGVFPALGDHANSAFVGEIALPADLASPVLLKVFADLDNGERHLVFARRFTPEFHRDPEPMPPLVRGKTFLRALWALQSSARRFALPRHGLIHAARAAWANYQTIPAYRPKKAHPVLEKTRPLPTGEISRALPTDAIQPPLAVLTNGHHDFLVSRAIAPADDMFVPGSSQYFTLGHEALLLVQDAVALAGGERVNAILDLPSGHGRVARWLRRAYPTASLSVSDTQGPGVSFCTEQLGATGVQAKIDGSHWAALPGPYDIIWCGSLLTHFGREQWVDHLRRFAERLSPRGVLVFTTHGLDALEKLQSGEKDYGLPQSEVTRLCAEAVAAGFGYVDYPETPAYGISVSLPDWIIELIEDETDLRVLDFRAAAWDQHQDVVVCTRRSAANRIA